ncbi:hypothetical protein ACSHXN_28150 [Streptomyces sp. HUAS TT11]|uniref:hypothetical protein n=1 Tax=Streptomyces sp. HUAS TT11 TaxID=3447508 RepID=UPI003F655FA6
MTTDAATVVPDPACVVGPHDVPPLSGNEVALVRPYVLAWETRRRSRPVLVSPHLPAAAWSALVGVR